MISRKTRSAGWAVFVLLSPVYGESPEPSDVPPDICDLAVLADRGTGDVIVSWSGGTPPFTVVRSDAADLRGVVLQRDQGPGGGAAKASEERTGTLYVVASGISSKRFVDHRAFDPGKRLFYQVYDSTSPPDVFGFSPDAGLPGAEVKVWGVGFPSDCDQITVQLGGAEVPTKLDCSFTGFAFRVPQGSVTGSLIIATPSGATVAGIAQEEFCRGKPRRPRSW